MITNYKASNPCPICGRYKTAYKDKCHGFITTDGKYAYCSREKSMEEGQRQVKTSYGKPLYRHALDGIKDTKRRNPSAILITQDPPGSIPKKRKRATQVTPKEPIQWNQEQEEAALEAVIRSFQTEKKWPYPSQAEEASEQNQSPQQRNQTPES